MRFQKLGLAEACLVELDRIEDERGFLARSFCRREFGGQGLVADFPQANVSWSARRGTLRGMHWQAAPFEEAKLVRCVRGAVHDVIVDLRRGSPSFARWLAVRLDAEERTALYVPPGFAHGFITLGDDVEMLYQMGQYYTPEAQRGFRWDDPAFGIRWPMTPELVSERDRSHPAFEPGLLDA